MALQANGYSAVKVRTILRLCRSGQADVLEEQHVVSKAFLPYVKRDKLHWEVVRVPWGANCFHANTEDPIIPMFSEG